MRVVFFGTPDWAVPALERLAGGPHEVVAVVAPPSRRTRRGAEPEPPAVARRAAALGLEVHQPDTVRSGAFLDWFESVRPDAAAIVAYGEILTRDLLAVPRHGFVNLHFSLLPRWRGAAPVQWAIAEGDPITGVTTMNVVRRLDAGDIYRQEEVAIAPGETSPMLGARLAEIGAGLMHETLAALEAGHQRRMPQDESLVTAARQLTREDGLVDWSLPAEVIARRVRAFDPWPGAVASCRGRRVRLLAACVAASPEDRGSEAVPGTIVALAGEDLVVACGGDTRLLVSRLVFDGGRPQSGQAAVSGRMLAVGDRLLRPAAVKGGEGGEGGLERAGPDASSSGSPKS